MAGCCRRDGGMGGGNYGKQMAASLSFIASAALGRRTAGMSPEMADQLKRSIASSDCDGRNFMGEEALGAELEHQLMASFHSPNLMIFDEAEGNYNDASLLGITVLMKSQSPYAYNEINRTKIQEAVRSQTGVLLPLDNIDRYLCDYVVVTGSFQTTN